MPDAAPTLPGKASPDFRFAEPLYALAFLGAHVAFIPFLALLLPRRVAAIGGLNANQLLGLLLIMGGLTASVANIAAGHVSDRAMARVGNRRATIAAGLACLALSYAWLALAHEPWTVGLGVVALQIAVNMLFAPIGVLLADYIPDHRKGRLSGLMNCATPIALGLVAAVTWLAPRDGLAGFAITWGLVAACVLPLIVAWPFPQIAPPVAMAPTATKPRPVRNLILVWLARCLMQLGATLMVNYLYPYLTALLHGGLGGASLSADAAVGWLALLGGAGACVGALGIGRGSDRQSDRRKPMVASALLAGTGVWLVARAANWPMLAAGYVLFQFALAAFLAVEGALLAEIVAHDLARGRLMGYINLANTVPAVVGAMLALTVSRHMLLQAGMRLALEICAAACLVAAGIILAIRRGKNDERRLLCHGLTLIR